MNGLYQIWLIAAHEWVDALRTRRALVVLILYMVVAMCSMYWAIRILQRMENELMVMLQLPQTEGTTGVVSTALWKSRPFQRVIKQVTQDDLVVRDITGKHPVELIYAWLAFFYTPLLVVLVAGNRIAQDIGSGAVRYAVFRVPRVCWSLGKFCGQVMLVGLALLLSATGAYVMARLWLAGSEMPGLLGNILQWSLRAWIYSIPFLGLAMGVSHLTRSASKATLYGILAITVCAILDVMVTRFTTGSGWRAYLPHLGLLVPNCHKLQLWRSTTAALVQALVYLVTLGFCFLLTGYAFLHKRDV